MGPCGVHVAISKALYEDVQKAISEGTECRNTLVYFVEALEEVGEGVPAEYKVLNSDGTFSETIGTTITAEDVKADFATTSVWGNYQISLEGLELDTAAIQGALLETSDGSIYGLEHLDNLWLQPGEVAFAVTEMTEPHGNTPSYQRFEDIQGKTITKLTYMIADGDDIAVDLDFYCKELLPGEYFVSVPETVIYDPEGTKLNVTEKVPEGSEYDLDSVLAGRYADGTWEGEGMGLNGPIRVAVVVEEGKIKEVKILERSDDDPYFKDSRQVIVPEILEQQTADVDGVSGAMFSSDGILEAVKEALTIPPV